MLAVDELIPRFSAEDEREEALAGDPALLEGWAWGSPRPGHPEGSVGAHVADLLRRIEEWQERGERRRDLRFVALVHDALKHEVRDWLPRAGRNHHAARARRRAELYTADERLLSTVELHDRPYALWRRLRRTGRLDERAVMRMVERLADPPLFLRFVELDGSTEGKDPRPVRWTAEELRRRSAL